MRAYMYVNCQLYMLWVPWVPRYPKLYMLADDGKSWSMKVILYKLSKNPPPATLCLGNEGNSIQTK